jgi:hypothetical protein
VSGSFDPFDPFGVVRATTESLARAQAQAREAARQARLNTAKADVTAAYTAWVAQPDRPAALNLQEAVTTYLSILEP